MDLASIQGVRAVTADQPIGATATLPNREARGVEVSISRDAQVLWGRRAQAEDPTPGLRVRPIGTDTPGLKPASTDSAPARGAQRAAASAEQARQAREDALLIAELSHRDLQVKSHEAAHMAAAGGLAGAPSYTYQTGPDGRSYAVGGEVPIDMSSGSTPEETLSRARRIRAAATAPADPSAQDLAVAAAATAMELEAQRQIQQMRSDAQLQARKSASHQPGDGCAACAKAAGRYAATQQAA